MKFFVDGGYTDAAAQQPNFTYTLEGREAIVAYTRLAAYLTFEEDIKGSLESGSWPTWWCCRRTC